MNSFSRLVLLGIGLLVVTSCSEEFLEQTPQQDLSIDNAVEDLTSLRAAVNGIYSNFQNPNMYGWDLPLLPELRGDNAYISFNNAGRFQQHDQFTLVDLDGRVGDEWLQHYSAVVNASNIIQRYPDATFLSTETDQAQQLFGEAHAQRGLTYWNLVKLFAQPYTNDNGQSPGVPLNNEGTTGELVSPPRASVAEVYNQVIADLEMGIQLMNTQTDGRLSAAAAQALLAKVHLYKEDWQNAETLASAVIESGEYTLYADSAAWFGSWGMNFGSEDLFALVNTGTDNLGTNSIGGIIDQDGYGDVLATEDLLSSYSDTDYRRSFIVRGQRVGGEEDALFPVGKYPEGETGQDYIKIMRLSDVYLIRAEARAELGNEDGARADLDAVASRRDAAYTDSEATGDALVDAILEERRRELAFEGDRVYDLMRRKRTWTKFRNPTLDDEVVSWDNPQLINPIPRGELDNNPNITENNPGY
ncbi:RagB/SusD family nutrient uptake outer membrane protein [Neolewinella sp.]|uniref:RagB/SusD family nutrient uptake outer membrane protein n=1 Tax=Neolewinella sp. TaxID=2993543 RepID=UPI003B52EB98